MSYTLTGRIESRLLATLPVLAAALAIHRWWAIEVVALMLAFGVALDVCVYDRLLDYQPAWAAVPLGALELWLISLAMRMPMTHATLGLYALGWASAQVLGHAVLPRTRLEYAEAGGELGRLGVVLALAVAVVAFGSVAGAVAVIPPTVHLHGDVQGPLVITRAETVVGGVVHGGIRVRSDHVTLKDVTVVGGEYGIDVEHAQHVLLDHVRLTGFSLDGIHALDAGLMVDRCSVGEPASNLATGVLVSYSMGRPMSMVSHCTVTGTREGIATHSSMVDVRHNHVVSTTARGISLSEMSMDSASHNEVESARGVGIVCMDHSTCEIEHNTVSGTKRLAGDPSSGVAIESYYYAEARVRHNTVSTSPVGVRAFVYGTISD